MNALHTIFNGHFPRQPILPGVCQLALIKDILQQHTGRKLNMFKADQIKFMAMIDPTKTRELHAEIQISEMEGVITAQAIISNSEIVFLKSKVRFANA